MPPRYWLEGSVSHSSIEINDEKCIPLCKRAFSKYLEGATWKAVSGGKPKDSTFQCNTYVRRQNTFWFIARRFVRYKSYQILTELLRLCPLSQFTSNKWTNYVVVIAISLDFVGHISPHQFQCSSRLLWHSLLTRIRTRSATFWKGNIKLRQGTLEAQTGIDQGHTTDLWRTAISYFDTLGHFCFRNGIWRTLGVQTGVAWRSSSVFFDLFSHNSWSNSQSAPPPPTESYYRVHMVRKVKWKRIKISLGND